LAISQILQFLTPVLRLGAAKLRFERNKLGKGNGDKFQYGGTWFQLGYANDQFGGGIEGHLMAKYKTDGDLDKLLLPLKPYFEFYGLYEGLTVGAYIKLASINADDIYVSPGVYAKFAF
jgi:hypothetical protein